MSQASEHPCPVCGTNVPAGQRFCSNCGTDQEVSRPASQYGGTPPPQNYPQAQQPVPPYAQSSYGQQQQYQQYQQPQQKSSPIAEALGALGLLFFLRRYRPGYRARRQSSGCCGCLVTLVILIIILGIPAFVVYRNNPHLVQQIQQNINNGNNGELPSTQPSITTAPINQTVTYAGVDITIVSVQQSTAFIDDSSSSANGVIRVKIKEANKGSNAANYLYSDVAHLILPDNNSVALSNALQSIGPANGTTRDNWLDFAVPTNDKIDKLTLVLGSSQDAQIRIPLTGKADLSGFQMKTANLNLPISYGGLNWTLKTAASSLSISGKQAPTGMRYIVLTFNVDNSTSGNVNIGFTDEYMRLKAGDITNPALNTTLPTTINAQQTGVSGTVTFLMPANATAFTLSLLAKPGGANPQSSVQVDTNFTI